MANLRKAVPVLARWVNEQRPLSFVEGFAALGRDEITVKFSRRFCSIPSQPVGSSRVQKSRIEIIKRQGNTGGQQLRSVTSLYGRSGRFSTVQNGCHSDGQIRRLSSDHGAEETESMDYDVVIAAIRLKQLCKEKDVDLSVCVVEKGAEVGKSLNFLLLVTV
jgi:hypothetical protein